MSTPMEPSRADEADAAVAAKPLGDYETTVTAHGLSGVVVDALRRLDGPLGMALSAVTGAVLSYGIDHSLWSLVGTWAAILAGLVAGVATWGRRDLP